MTSLQDLRAMLDAKRRTDAEVAEDAMEAWWDTVCHDPSAVGWRDVLRKAWECALEPTDAMIHAGDACMDLVECEGVWRAMMKARLEGVR